MSPTENEDDPSFVALSARLRRRIDGAFDSIVPPGTPLQPSLHVPAGGFIVEESGFGASSSRYDEAGGFIVEDPPGADSSYIPLSEIPRALSILGLVPDDDIMGVFENAASGWGARNTRNDGVSKKDWRAVCAALFEGEHTDGSDEVVVDGDGETGTDSSDEYLSGDTEEASGDDYEESTGIRAKKLPRRTPTKNSGMGVPRQLTESQKASCRREFSRFLPHVQDVELDHQRITVKDLARVADLLKEDLKTEQMLEMLEAFSTSPDKSMNLADFERMMVLTKLV